MCSLIYGIAWCLKISKKGRISKLLDAVEKETIFMTIFFEVEIIFET